MSRRIERPGVREGYDRRSDASQAGFRRLEWHEYRGDERLVEEVPAASRYPGSPLLLLVRAERAL